MHCRYCWSQCVWCCIGVIWWFGRSLRHDMFTSVLHSSSRWHAVCWHTPLLRGWTGAWQSGYTCFAPLADQSNDPASHKIFHSDSVNLLIKSVLNVNPGTHNTLGTMSIMSLFFCKKCNHISNNNSHAYRLSCTIKLMFDTFSIVFVKYYVQYRITVNSSIALCC